MNKPIMNPSKGNAFMLFLLCYNIAVTFAFSILYWRLQDTSFYGIFTTPLFTITSQLICFIVPLGITLVLNRHSIADFMPRVRLDGINVILIVSLCLCLQPVMMLLSAVAAIFFPNPVSEIMSDMQDYPVPAVLAAMALTPALCEELVFRGYLFAHYRRVDIKKAAFINGLFFGMMHMNAQQFLYAFFMGVIFAYMVYYTRSIMATVLAHFTVNTTQYLLNWALTAFSSSSAETAELTANEVATASDMWSIVLYMAVVSLVFLPAIVILFRSFITHNRQRNISMDMREALASYALEEDAYAGDAAGEDTYVEDAAEEDTLVAGGTEALHGDNVKTPLTADSDGPFNPLFWGVVVMYLIYMLL